MPALTVMLVPCATGTSLQSRTPRVQRVRSKETRVKGMTNTQSPRSAMARLTMYKLRGVGPELERVRREHWRATTKQSRAFETTPVDIERVNYGR